MGFLKKPSYTKPIPADAAVVKKGKGEVALWTVRGEAREAPVVVGRDGSRRIRIKVATFHAHYSDQDGVEQRVDTKCETRIAANAVLVGLERTVEQIRAGHLTVAENQRAVERGRPYADVLEDFLADRKAKKRDDDYLYELRRMLERIGRECDLKTLADLSLEGLETWVAARLAADVGVTTIKRHTDAARALCRWAVRRGRLKADPTVGLELAAAELDRRRVRRAYSPEELARLLAATLARPERDAAMIRRGARKGQLGNLKPDVREKLRLLGRERCLIYKTLLLTGLRLDELRSTRVSQATLDGPAPSIKLDASQAKSRRVQRVELPDTLAAELARWIRERGLKPSDKLLFVADDFDRIWRLDAAMAGLEVKDQAGRSLDIHALRHTLATRLADAGVPLVVAQSIMRHSDPRLTAGAYIDSEALRTKRPAVDQVSQGLTEAVAAARRHFDPNSLMVARELAAQLAGHGPGLGDHHRMARDFVAGTNLTQTEAESMIAGFRTEVRQLADRVMSRGFQLPGQDSNLEKQDQNLL